ncbi:hypothetical protein KY332_04640 [Candidatus Woesearchaeota archaeon]|nr:hypothetical protein [Candidatus Woesearchaeota archaeon]
MKKVIILFVFLIGLVVCSVGVMGDVSVINHANGKIGYDTTSGYGLQACSTSDGGEILIERDISSANGYETFYFYKLNSSNEFTTTKKQLHQFNADNKTAPVYRVVCDGNKAYLVAPLCIGKYYTYDSNYLVVNCTGHSILQVIAINETGDQDFYNETQKTYTITDIDAEVDDYLQLTLGATTDTIDALEDFDFAGSSYDYNNMSLKYLRFDKTTGDLLDEKDVFTGFYTEPNIVGDGSNNLYMTYNNYSGYLTTLISDIYFTKINATGDVLLNPVKLNTLTVDMEPHVHLNDVDIDSNGKIHAIWNENDTNGITQVMYGKIEDDGTVLVNKNISNHTTEYNSNEFALSLFLEVEGSLIDVYYQKRVYWTPSDFYTSSEYNLLGNISAYDSSLEWINLTTDGSVEDKVTISTTRKLFGLGQPCSADDPCAQTPSQAPPNGNGGVPEFSPTAIIFIVMIIGVVYLMVLKKRNNRRIKK